MTQIHARNSPANYNQVPDYCFKDGGSILDVGCMSGLNALISKHRNYFLEAEANKSYQGVDLLVYPKNYLDPIIIDDLREFWTDESFNLVLALHVMEHIEIEYWNRIICKLQHFVKPGGFLVIGVPYKSRDPEVENPHVVFDIDENMIRDFLPRINIYKHRKSYPHFREPNESLVWAIGRFFWRIVTRHDYRWRIQSEAMVVVWKKGLKK